MFRIAPAVLAALAVASPAFATDISVGPSQSIQAAIDSAQNGDRVLVLPGTYAEALSIANKSIELIGIGGANATTVDATGIKKSTIRLSGAGSRVAGLRVVGGVGTQKGAFPFFRRYGGGIYATGDVAIEECLIELNTTIFGIQAPDGAYGGGAYLESGAHGTPRIERCLVRENKAYWGGGVYGGLIVRCVIEANDGTDGGGVAAPFELRASRIVANVAKRGGGVFLTGEAQPPPFDDVRLEGNVADYGGGAWGQFAAGMFGTFATTLEGLRCVANTSTVRGGGIEFQLNASTVNPIPIPHVVLVRDCAFANNAAPQAAGLSVTLFANPGIQLPNCVSAIDRCSFDGDDVQLAGNASFVTNSAFTNHATPLAFAGGGAQVDSCIVPGAFPGTGSFNANPAFFDGTNGDLHLMAASPAIDLGVATANGVAPFDFERDAPVGTADIGADERAARVYVVGRTAPGATVALRVVGSPGDQAFVFVSATQLATPIATSAGPWFLGGPIAGPIPLGTVPATGVLSLAVTIPGSVKPFDQVHTQVILVSGQPAHLTNVETIAYL